MNDNSADGGILLDCKSVTKSYSGTTVLDKVDFSIRRGEDHALVGENGAGKSTLVKLITGVTNRDSGAITFDGKTVPIEHSRKLSQELGIAVIYQELSLIPGMTVAQNIFLTKEPLMGKTRLIADTIYAQDNQATLARIYGASWATGLSAKDVREWPRYGPGNPNDPSG